MNSTENLIAIGRSRYLYDAIVHLNQAGFAFKAIVTEEAYEEYDIKHHDFERLANNIGAEFFITKNLDVDEICRIIRNNNIRLAISANWKFTIPESFLNLFQLGILNFHLGNLPDYKGNATVNWSIINGEKFIYGNIHKMVAKLDAGDVVARRCIPITNESYISEILKQAEEMAPSLYEEALKKVIADPETCEVKGTVHGLRCYPRLPEDSQINWGSDVHSIHRLIRASSHPYSGAFSFLNGQKIVVWKATPYHPEERILAMPGHVVEVNKLTNHILVVCDNGLLEVQEISIDSKRMLPATYIKSIRARFKFKSDV